VNEELEKQPKTQKLNKIPDILGAFVLITLGILLLLNNVELLSWDIWFYIGKFWPVIFIFIGLNIFSDNSLFLRMVTTLIGISILLFILSYSLYNTEARFRSYINKNFPGWEKIYNSVPSNSAPVRQEYYFQQPFSV
jgi:hypothetical protein